MLDEICTIYSGSEVEHFFSAWHNAEKKAKEEIKIHIFFKLGIYFKRWGYYPDESK